MREFSEREKRVLLYISYKTDFDDLKNVFSNKKQHRNFFKIDYEINIQNNIYIDFMDFIIKNNISKKEFNNFIVFYKTNLKKIIKVEAEKGFIIMNKNGLKLKIIDAYIKNHTKKKIDNF